MKDITGKKYNRLVALRFVRKDKHYNQFWLFRCECGSSFVGWKAAVVSGHTRSCGCYAKEVIATSKPNLRHGLIRHPLYGVWKGMKQRITLKTLPSYPAYGGRGLKMSKRWLKDFMSFYKDMSPSYVKGLSIERIDNNKGYFKNNCRWATRVEQSRNRRGLILYKGETASAASLRLKGSVTLVSARVRRGWSIEKAFTTPA